MFSVYAAALVAARIEGEPSVIIQPIAIAIGFLINVIYAAISSVSTLNALGISIIILTVIMRTLMLPLAFRTQKSTAAMRKLTPEVERIKQKYKDAKDPELQKKMNMEIQALYSKNKVSLFGGCLPMLVTLPIFLALSYVMRQPYIFGPEMGAVYNNISAEIHKAPDWLETVRPIIAPLVPKGMTIDIGEPESLSKALNVLTPENWDTIIALSPETGERITALLKEKTDTETFFGINLIANPSLSFPSILMPILAGLTQFLTFWMMGKNTAGQNDAVKTQNTVMKFVMPVMMVFFTMSVSSGVGLYWNTSNVYQVLQQFLMNKYYKGDKKDDNIIDDPPKPKKGFLPGNKKA